MDRFMSEADISSAPLSLAERKVARAYQSEGGLSRRFRAGRFRRLQALIDDIIAREGRCRIVDIGGTRYYWDIAEDFVASRPVEITLVNKAPSDRADGKFTVVDGDATDLSQFGNQAFDLVHSNSVIEHVGDWAAMKKMASEVARLAPAYYVQAPNFWFPIEPHFRCAFFHWLPEQIRYRLVMTFALGFSERKETADDAMARVQSARLLDGGQMRALFPDAELYAERVAGLAKSFIAVRRPGPPPLG